MGKPVINMIGFKSHRWTVVSEAEKPEKAKHSGKYWNCVCDCGVNRVVHGSSIRSGQSKSCGCLKSEISSSSMRKMRLEKSGTVKERFFSRFVKLENGCWQWRSHTDKDGYGVLPGANKSIRAHRLSYEIHIGEIPKDMVVCHRCDNPGCVNPEHLFIGTQKDNAQDALKKNRHYIGEKNGRAKLTRENVDKILTSDESSNQLAKKFGVSVTTIRKVRRGTTWQK